MDVKQYMIVDLERRGDKRMFITERVSEIRMGERGLWEVRFVGSERVFHYNRSRLLCLTNPVKVDLLEKGVYVKNKHMTNVVELLRFGGGRHVFYFVRYQDGYYESIEGDMVYVTRTPIDKNGGSRWDYLKKLAAETSLLTSEEESILSMEYDLVDVHRDNVPLAQYLGDKTGLGVWELPNRVYYPFGCNASQKAAVEAALSHQVSIIQGPPGTGKTQTILNIIANLLLGGKSVLVVSNNNSAVENVAEKLAKEGLDFLVAKLGSTRNKETFIENQPLYPEMGQWLVNEVELVAQREREALEAVSKGFAVETECARLKADYDNLMKEKRYNELLGGMDENDWLNGREATGLLSFLNLYQRRMEHGRGVGWWFRLRWGLKLGLKMYRLLREKPTDVIRRVESAYYYAYKRELEGRLKSAESVLRSIDMGGALERLKVTSMQVLKHGVAERYGERKRVKFELGDIKCCSAEFMEEYPVVLSTTYSAKSCISKRMVFDYVIMDEASQVDIKTGALALSCAMNAVIVGDDKQLPNVVGREEQLALEAIQLSYGVDDRYNAVTHSFLQSCTEVFKDAPSTLLREHYRCHPKIIEFCNQRFYDGELVTMTRDGGEERVLEVVRTVKGNHARGHCNQREIDVIRDEVMPEYEGMGTVGIITPYRMQADAINGALGGEVASTVHKYQGRECDVIIMSMVDNEPTEFSDDANLLNVAISRAKRHLCVVTNGNEMNPDSNLAQLIGYVRYNNFEVKESKLHSVFDLLYRQYTAERLAYEAKHGAVSEYLSENLIYGLLLKVMGRLGWRNMEVVCHYPLRRLIGNGDMLDGRERSFVEGGLSHVDFLIFNVITKQPRLAIEVDGWSYHRGSEAQQERDGVKDGILRKCGLRLVRISTAERVDEEVLRRLIS